MHKTNVSKNENKLVVGIDGLQDMLSIGKNNAALIGEAAGAVVRVGRRKLYNVAKIQAYIDSITDNSEV